MWLTEGALLVDRAILQCLRTCSITGIHNHTVRMKAKQKAHAAAKGATILPPPPPRHMLKTCHANLALVPLGRSRHAASKNPKRVATMAETATSGLRLTRSSIPLSARRVAARHLSNRLAPVPPTRPSRPTLFPPPPAAPPSVCAVCAEPAAVPDFSSRVESPARASSPRRFPPSFFPSPSKFAWSTPTPACPCLAAPCLATPPVSLICPPLCPPPSSKHASDTEPAAGTPILAPVAAADPESDSFALAIDRAMAGASTTLARASRRSAAAAALLSPLIKCQTAHDHEWDG